MIRTFEGAESKKDEELRKARLIYIRLKAQLKKAERHLREKEQLADGLHLIDFEQLKIENQTLNEKIEERNEELHKLRKKKTTTVQVLTHIKEKLQFVEGQAETLKQELGKLDRSVVLLCAGRSAATAVRACCRRVPLLYSGLLCSALLCSFLLCSALSSRPSRVVVGGMRKGKGQEGRKLARTIFDLVSHNSHLHVSRRPTEILRPREMR